MDFSLGGLWDAYKTYTPSGMLINHLGNSMQTPGITGPEQQMLTYNDALKQREQQTFDQQNRLSQLLFGAAQGQGPSVAGQQLGAGMDLINRNAMTQAAGASGQNGVLARFQAMQTAATAGAETNQQAAVARAGEINQARALLGQNLGQMGDQSGNLYKTNVAGFTGLRDADNTAKKNQNDQFNKLLGSGLNAASGGGAVQGMG